MNPYFQRMPTLRVLTRPMFLAYNLVNRIQIVLNLSDVQASAGTFNDFRRKG